MITRRLRRLLLVPAVGLVLLGAPALAIDQPTQARPTTTHVPFVLPMAQSAPAGWSADASVAANLVGVQWAGDPASQFAIEVRGPSGTWHPAGQIGPIDVTPDEGSPDAASARGAGGEPNASEPLWVGDADAVRVTLVSGSVSSVTLDAVQSLPAQAPNGSVGALGVSFPPGPDRFGFAIALLVLGLGLGAIAVGWSPWRSRRSAACVVAVAIVLLAGCVPPDPTPPPPPPTALPAQPAMTMRTLWGADLKWNPDPSCAPGPTIASSLKFAVVHHTVNSNTYAPGDSTAMVRAIWQYHVVTLGYCDIAYNFLVDRYGQIFEGRMGGIDKAVVAAHSGGFNTSSTGAAFIGDWSAAQPPAAAWDAMVNLLAWKLSVHHVDPSLGFTTTAGAFSGAKWPAGTVVSFPNAIIGHRDVDSTECPGNAFYPRLAELRTAVQPHIGWDDPASTTTTTTTEPPTTTTT